MADPVSADVGFEPSPTGATLCGFALPSFSYSLSINLPSLLPFPFPPRFDYAVQLNCNLSDPFDASFGFGGGRVPTGPDPDEDPEYGVP